MNSHVDQADLPLHELSSSAPFQIGGNINCEEPFTLFFKRPDGSSAYISFPNDVSDSQKLQVLLDSCQPASFGKGNQEVLDPAYRKALALSPKDFALNLPLSTSSILWDIHTLLQPEAASVTAELYKLNIYGPGGFFKSHRDTPRGPSMFGSLVVCLPTPFTGGELVVKNASGVQYTHAWGIAQHATGAASSSEAAAGYSLQWAAFYSDVKHEILPVTEGYRVTLTYNLFSKPQSPALASDAATSSSSQRIDFISRTDTLSNGTFGKALAMKLQDDSWHPSGVTLGFALEHQYVENATMPTKLEPYMLKGSDLVLYRIASELNLEVKLLPLIKARYYDPDNVIDEEDEDEDVMPGGKLLGAAFEKHSKSMGGWCDDEEQEKDFLIDRHGATASENIVWLKEPDSQHFKYRDTAATFGNAVCDKAWYVAAVMLVEVPKAPRTLPQGAQAVLSKKRVRS